MEGVGVNVEVGLGVGRGDVGAVAWGVRVGIAVGGAAGGAPSPQAAATVALMANAARAPAKILIAAVVLSTGRIIPRCHGRAATRP
jgi:hypothetical protein